MKFDLPEKASIETLQIDVRDVEAMLQGPCHETAPLPGCHS